jgi:hypothetical protein
LTAGTSPAIRRRTGGSVDQRRASSRSAFWRWRKDRHAAARWTNRSSCAVNRDSSADTLMMGPADFDALYPLDGALHHGLNEFDFLQAPTSC